MRLRIRRKHPTAIGDQTLLYYASDVHGSDRCWRKFLRAGEFYGTDAIVMGGDLTGKAIIPIARDEDGTFRLDFLGERRVLKTEKALHELIEAVRFNGMYPWVAGDEEIAASAADPDAQGALFDLLIGEEIARWVALADDRLASQPLSAFVIAGNDDPWSVDDPLSSAKHLVMSDGVVTHVGRHEMMSCSYSNPTPWNSPRELPEEELYGHLRRLADQLEDPAAAIFNLHVPPFDSGLDTAQQLTDDLTPVYRNGEPVEIPVGSTAVRQILEECQPALSLHGHIHESRGHTRIGHTLAVNSGSEYNSGRLHGALIRMDSETGTAHACQFVEG